MPANANAPVEEAVPVDRSVREVIAICAKHGVPYGSPDELPGFLRALDENKHLAMNFWSVVARLSDKEPRFSEPDWLLGVIVEGVTGRPLAELAAAGDPQMENVSRLRGLLAGEDIHGPAELPAVAPAPDEDNWNARQARWNLLVKEAQLPHADSPEAAIPQPVVQPEPVLPVARRAPATRSGRIVLAPDPEPKRSSPRANRAQFSHADDDRPVVIPLSSYADATSTHQVSRNIVGGAFLLALLAFGASWLDHSQSPSPINRFGASIRAGYDSAVSAWKGQSGAQATPAPAAPAATLPETPVTAASTTPPNSPAANPTPVAATPIAQPEEPSAADIPSDARVVVPAELMKQNLVSSRVPVFPTGTTEGRVLIQAVVTKRGTVAHAHVIQGNPALRRAAIDAVLAWRYRPYLLNGRPVDVTTTIPVDVSPDAAQAGPPLQLP